MSVRILVVEDEYFIAQEVAEALAGAGLSVLGPCATVSAALALLAGEESCAAAVLDANLRGESSLPVCEALSARGIPFIIVTGFTAGQIPAAMAAGPVLAKPLDPARLVAVLQGLIAGA